VPLYLARDGAGFARGEHSNDYARYVPGRVARLEAVAVLALPQLVVLLLHRRDGLAELLDLGHPLFEFSADRSERWTVSE
jgi:hypothetical protein